MKPIEVIGAIIGAVMALYLFSGCAVKPGPVTPKPDIGRVITANKKTSESIGRSS